MSHQTREIRPHGNEKLNIAVYLHNRDDVSMGRYFPIHWHFEYEFIYVQNGKITVDIEGVSHSVKKGQGLFINKKYIHSCTQPLPCNIQYACIVFGEQFLFPSATDFIFENEILPLSHAQMMPPLFISGEQPWEQEVLQEIKKLLHRYQTAGMASALYMRIRLLEVFDILLQNQAFVPLNHQVEGRSDRIRSPILYIQNNIHRDIRVAELAEVQNICPEHFSRLFRSVTGVSPKQYILRCRMDHAAKLLHTRSTKIAEAALQCGFEDVNYFSRCFKKMKGFTPSEYRTKHFKKQMEI